MISKIDGINDTTKLIIWQNKWQKEAVMIKEDGWSFAPTTWNNRHGEAADDLERADDSSIPLAGHLEVKRSREREYFCILDIFLSLKQKKIIKILIALFNENNRKEKKTLYLIIQLELNA